MTDFEQQLALWQARVNFFTGVQEGYEKDYAQTKNPQDLKIAAYHEGRKDEILQNKPQSTPSFYSLLAQEKQDYIDEHQGAILTNGDMLKIYDRVIVKLFGPIPDTDTF